MRTTLQLAAVTITLMTAGAYAQVSNPDNLIAPPPTPIQFHGKHLIKPVTDFQWLWQYTAPGPDGNEGALLTDVHFRSMLRDNLTAPQAFWRDGKLPLSDVARLYFTTSNNSVHGIDNRYVTLGGCVASMCEDQGLLWIDTASQHPTVVFAATEWTTEGKPAADPNASFNLWLFASRPLDPDSIPPSLVAAIADWNAIAPQHIQTALLIDPDGTPHKVDPATLGATPSKNTPPPAPKK
jgi:hypothetical protein